MDLVKQTGKKIRQKIIIIGPAYPYRGGIANFTDSLYKELIKENDVRIITFKRQYPAILFPGKTQFEEENQSESVPTEMLMDSINPLNWYSVGKKIRDEAPDLLIIKFWLPFFSPCYSKISKIVKTNNHTKIVAICHNIIPHERKPGDKLLTAHFFKYVDYFILLSKKVVNDLTSINTHANYRVLFHPVYSKFGDRVEKAKARFLLNIKTDKVILFFGLIRNYKGLDDLLKAMSLLKGKINVHLIIAGEFYTDSARYKNLIKKYGLSDKIYLFDMFIPEQEVKNFFCASDALILPYKHATQSGIVQIAMNFGKPVIATNVGGLGEVIEHGRTGYIVEKENPAQLADAIYKFYKEKKEKEFADNIEKERDKYSWKNFTINFFDYLKQASNKVS